MIRRFCRLLAAAALLAILAPGGANAAQGVRYALTTQSRVVQVCSSCATPAGRPETLRGSFNLTSVPLAKGAHVDAITEIDWQSESYHITGTGIVQALPSGVVNIVIDAHINGESMQLRATRRQPRVTSGFTVLLATPDGSPVEYLVVLNAEPEGEANPVLDVDLDGVADVEDNCRATANSEQTDGDIDGVGDACDLCLETTTPGLANHDGCDVEQLCPCDADMDGVPWRRGTYGRCVARAVRELRRAGAVSKSDAARIIRGALRSGCGQTVVALR